MIVQQPWLPLPLPDNRPQQRQWPGPPTGMDQRQKADFLAELLKLSLNAAAVQSLVDRPDATDPTADMLRLQQMASQTIPIQGPTPFPATPGNPGQPSPALDLLGPLTAPHPGSPATLVALTQAVADSRPASGGAEPNESSLRRAISAYTPRFSAEGFRQKIDFSSRRDAQPDSLGLPTRSGPSDPDHLARTSDPIPPGVLAARFESANRPDAIGYDRLGGTCYGTYQLSSRMGGMEAFLGFLDSTEPRWAERLRAAGPANTKSRNGAMPMEWKRIHREHPERFAALQHAFTRKAYFDPAARLVRQRTGIDLDHASPALREVLWSTAVQHGVHGAANVFHRALESATEGNRPLRESELIQAIYSERNTRFTGSTQAVRSAVQSRFEEEMHLAMTLLGEDRDILA